MDQTQPIAPEETRLDLRGLKCPLPALKTRAALRRLEPEAILLVEATDPMAAIDIPHLVAETGHTLLELKAEGPLLIFRIRKVARPVSREDRRDGES